MKIAILGTGRFASDVSKGAARVGHRVTLGSRRPDDIEGMSVPVKSFDAAVEGVDLVINGLPGEVAIALLPALESQLTGQVLLDASNAVLPSGDLMFPNASVGQILQAALPRTFVVKSMLPMAGYIAVDPGAIPATSNIFVAGNDAEAKGRVTEFLSTFGWTDEAVLDLGDIDAAKGLEHTLFLFFSLVAKWGTGEFNFSVIRGSLGEG